MGGKLTLCPGLKGAEASLATIPADVRVAVIEVTVPFATVLHAQLVGVPNATVETIAHVRHQ